MVLNKIVVLLNQENYIIKHPAKGAHIRREGLVQP